MAPTFTWIIVQALVFITINVVHAQQIVDGECLSSCKKYNSRSLRATILFGDLATPLGYKEVTAICPGRARPQPCTRIATPPIFYDPRAPTFTCCTYFRVVTGPLDIRSFQTAVVITYDAAVVVARLTDFRRAERTGRLRISCIEPPRDNPFRTIQFDSPVVIPVGDPQGVNYTRIDKVEACYFKKTI